MISNKPLSNHSNPLGYRTAKGLIQHTPMKKQVIAAVLLATTMGAEYGCVSQTSSQEKDSSPQIQGTEATVATTTNASDTVKKADNEVWIEGGEYERSTDQGKKEKVKVASFFLDKNLTTVAEFEAFVKTTGYVTDAEKFGNSAFLDQGQWALKEGANFRYPFGKEAKKAEANHPVTQVSWNDASAYAKWKGKRLPTEHEWEFASTNRGKSIQKYAWGNAAQTNGKYLANTFQGTFPQTNTVLDGYENTSPVGTFPANALGLFDLGGNVWQFTSDVIVPTAEQAQEDPSPRHPLKGGSFITDLEKDPDALLFHHSSTTSETSVFHTGFRLAKDK